MSACHPGKIAFHKTADFEWQADVAEQSMGVNLTSQDLKKKIFRSFVFDLNARAAMRLRNPLDTY